MSNKAFKQTGLWKRAFPSESAGDHAEHCENLSSEFSKFRKNVACLVAKIISVLPQLTVHDVTHLDGLWQTADLIAGNDYPLNPLETFVFGGAILLHDSAMCWEAYDGGQAAVRETLQWKDAYSFECDRCPNVDDDERRIAADFTALRELHASQANVLTDRSWKHPDTGYDFYLIEDTSLRIHLGQLIGKIASSHHWDIDELPRILGQQYNAPAPFPSEWIIDPVKIACLLRCADAAHINQERAPDFLYALSRRSGISFNHWQSQNRMSGPAIDSSDPSKSTIIYTTTLPFKESDADSWWLAYDAITIINKELQTANKMLRDRVCSTVSPEFKIKNVNGAESIEALTSCLRVEGWTPTNAELHVSNIAGLVRELGGEQLYGTTNKVEVALRELIQNARDAIVARRNRDPEYEGKIRIRPRIIGVDKWIFIEDDGIGMSRSVMLGPLLDFGSSFWKSQLLQKEFPGLRSSGFRSIGRFGIGFYSVFMISDSVEVLSRKYEEGLAGANHLIFKDGLTFRPLFRQAKTSEVSTSFCTQIRLKLKEDFFEDGFHIEVKPSYSGVSAFLVPLKDFVSALCVGLDVRIEFSPLDGTKENVHENHIGNELTYRRILERISFSKFRSDVSILAHQIERNYHRLRPIYSDGKICGYAAISTSNQTDPCLLGIRTVGGLADSISMRNSHTFIGYVDCHPLSARRAAGQLVASADAIQQWAIEQREILKTSSLQDEELSIATINLCEIGVDPTEISRLLVSKDGKTQFLTFDQIASLAHECLIGVFKGDFADHIETHHSLFHLNGVALILPLINSNALSLQFDDNGAPSKPLSLIDCLHRAIENQGRIPRWSELPGEFPSAMGRMRLLTLSSA